MADEGPKSSVHVETENASTEKDNKRTHIYRLQQKIYPGVRISLLLSLVVYLAMLVIGGLGVHKCPVEQNIPLFLIATGAVGILSKLITYTREKIGQHIPTTHIETCLYTVEMVFFILGCYWVYKEYPPSYSPGAANYCRKTTYLFAFIYLTTALAIGGAIIAGFICFLICICFLSSQIQTVDVESQRQEQPRSNQNLISP